MENSLSVVEAKVVKLSKKKIITIHETVDNNR